MLFLPLSQFKSYKTEAYISVNRVRKRVCGNPANPHHCRPNRHYIFLVRLSWESRTIEIFEPPDLISCDFTHVHLKIKKSSIIIICKYYNRSSLNCQDFLCSLYHSSYASCNLSIFPLYNTFATSILHEFEFFTSPGNASSVIPSPLPETMYG